MTKSQELCLLVPVLTTALLSAVSVGPGCATDPVTGKRRFSVVRWTPEQELEIGREAAPNVESEFDAIDPDPEANRRLGSLLKDMVGHSVRKDDLEFRFKVLNSSVPNAFALPGGFVYVTRGLLQLIDSEGQFISIMGHELGHVEHQHSMQNQSRGTVAGVLTAPLRLALSVARKLPGPTENVVGLAAGLAVAPLALWGLSYSRSQELEADERGVYFSAEMGYNPREGVKTFEMFERLEKEAGASQLAWFRTHPLNRDRITNIERIIERQYPELVGKPDSDFRGSSPGFKAILETYKANASAYKLYDEAAASITNPDVTPADFETAVGKLDEAQSLVPDEPLFLIAQGEAAVAKEDLEAARPHFERALALYGRLSPGDSHWKAHFYLGLLEVEAKDAVEAIKQLQAARERFPLHPAVLFFLGQAYELQGNSALAREAYRQAMDLAPEDSELYREARNRWSKL